MAWPEFLRLRRVSKAASPELPSARNGLDIRESALGVLGAPLPRVQAFTLPQAAPGVIAQDAKLTCDAACDANYRWALGSAFAEGLGFLGYPYLAELTQRPEYRRPAEILAKEMTRKWIRLQSAGEEDRSEKIAQIDAEMQRLNVQAAFRKAAEQDGFFGRAQLFLDMGDDRPEELVAPLADSVTKIGPGGLKRLQAVEPVWTYPGVYNSTDPLSADFYQPQTWFVMNRQVHASRLLTFVSRPLPDMLKPAYAFGGLSLSQIAKPYVDNWLRTRQSVSDLLHSFSTMVLKTNLAAVLNAEGAEQMLRRAVLFNQARDNRHLMMIDRDTEDFANVSAPLGSLDRLQAQSQEHMAAVTGIPLIVLLGITPSGLNATSEGELRTFYAWIEAQQEALFTAPLTRLLNVIQLSLFGEIDPDIGFSYVPLWTLSEEQLANMRKVEADTGIGLINAGVISPEEERVRLASQEDGPYASLDLNEEPPEPPLKALRSAGGAGLEFQHAS
ncbi:DUF1073 domain-containing protein [Paraburkholderia adhaesiva]|uniref:DUF1073 domain-containing protein n=1 Tax=Paraburkholderia adhaesiva TaxID=2883244 RepID=UPI001F3971FF|nr:DUF1073 domain-containing protein [Paraburkholderia adhaesiva]